MLLPLPAAAVVRDGVTVAAWTPLWAGEACFLASSATQSTGGGAGVGAERLLRPCIVGSNGDREGRIIPPLGEGEGKKRLFSYL